MGFITGFYTSPHLIDVRERFRVNGKSIGREEFNAATEKLVSLCGSEKFTYFEFVTILAAVIFKDAGCDFVIWETGMGGRLDATNIVSPEAVVITNIALDHQERLGQTLSEIAAEKAGIIKRGVPVFYGELVPEAKEVIEKKAAELGCAVYPPLEAVPALAKFSESATGFIQSFDYCQKRINLSLGGRMQRENFRIVCNVLAYLAGKYRFDFDESLKSLDKVIWPARFQKVNERVIVDGGYNPDGVHALACSLDEFCSGTKFTVIFAAFEDKDVAETLELLSSKYASEFIFTRPAPWGRASHRFETLRAIVPETMPCRWSDDISGALDMALSGKERILVCGSLHLAGSVLQILLGEDAACDLVHN
jgi:dihydrofolate synthase/folylpolyglutamate synthase